MLEGIYRASFEIQVLKFNLNIAKTLAYCHPEGSSSGTHTGGFVFSDVVVKTFITPAQEILRQFSQGNFTNRAPRWVQRFRATFILPLLSIKKNCLKKLKKDKSDLQRHGKLEFLAKIEKRLEIANSLTKVHHKKIGDIALQKGFDDIEAANGLDLVVPRAAKQRVFAHGFLMTITKDSSEGLLLLSPGKARETTPANHPVRGNSLDYPNQYCPDATLRVCLLHIERQCFEWLLGSYGQVNRDC